MQYGSVGIRKALMSGGTGHFMPGFRYTACVTLAGLQPSCYRSYVVTRLVVGVEGTALHIHPFSVRRGGKADHKGRKRRSSEGRPNLPLRTPPRKSCHCNNDQTVGKLRSAL